MANAGIVEASASSCPADSMAAVKSAVFSSISPIFAADPQLSSPDLQLSSPDPQLSSPDPQLSSFRFQSPPRLKKMQKIAFNQIY